MQHVKGHSILGDVSTSMFRPVVPSSFSQQGFEMIHGIAHPGTWASRCLILSRFVWKHAASDVATMAHTCLTCQQGKVHRHIHVRPPHIPVPSRHFSQVHVDLVGPLPASKPCRMLHVEAAGLLRMAPRPLRGRDPTAWSWSWFWFWSWPWSWPSYTWPWFRSFLCYPPLGTATIQPSKEACPLSPGSHAYLPMSAGCPLI